MMLRSLLSRSRRFSFSPFQPTAAGLVATALFILVSTAAGAEPPDAPELPVPQLQGEWREMRTPHFTLFGDAASWQMRQVGDSLESLRLFLDQTSSVQIDAPVPSYVYVFRDRQSFDPYRPLQPNGEPLSAGGFFSRREHANYIAIDGSQRNAVTGTAFHEYLHYYSSYHTPGLPLWLREGIAELYSTFEVEDNQVTVGKFIPRHLKWLQQNEMMPLLHLFAVQRDSPAFNESERRGAVYAQSWALVHYLFLRQPDGARALGHFLKLQKQLPADEAFHQAFGITPDAMQAQLRQYIHSKVFAYRQAELAIDDLRQQFTFRDLPRSETLARLGELLAAQGREDAKEHSQAALALHPNETRAHVSLGMLAMFPERDFDTAVEHFAKARRLAPEDRWMTFLHARARFHRGDDRTDLRQDFAKVVNASPQFAHGWRLLAWSWAGETQHLGEATKAFEGAHRLLPEDEQIAEGLLYFYDRAGRTEDAERLIDRSFRPRGLDPRQPVTQHDDAGHAVADSERQTQGVEQALTVEINAEAAQRLIEQAEVFLAQREYQVALSIYDILVRHSSDPAEFISKRDEIRQIFARQQPSVPSPN